MRPKYVQDKILFTPTDSAKYHTQIPNCSVWPKCTAGTIQHYNHILLSWMALTGNKYPPAHVGAYCTSQTDFIRKMVCAVPPPTLEPYPSVAGKTCNPEGKYWEADVLGSVRYPEGVKFIVASFSDYFGNVTGSDLRAWCIRHKWALLWVNYDNKLCQDPRRMLDPVVLESTAVNVTLSISCTTRFSTLWQQANMSWSAYASNLANGTQWNMLVKTKM